jgi:hypothetical protein
VGVLLGFGQKHAVGHYFNVPVTAGVVTETDLETDGLARLFTEFFCYSPRNGGRCDSPGLGTPDGAVNPEPCFQAHFWDLCAFSRSCVPSNDDHLIILDSPDDLLGLSADGKMGWISDSRPIFQSLLPPPKGLVKPVFQ